MLLQKNTKRSINDPMLENEILSLEKQPKFLKFQQETIQELIAVSEDKYDHVSEEAGSNAMIRGNVEFLQKSIDIIFDRISDDSFDLNIFAAEMNISKSTLTRYSNQFTGLTPLELILYIRMKYSRILLHENALRIAEIAYQVGFKDPNYYSKCFRERMGLSPKAYREVTNVQNTEISKNRINKQFLNKATSLIKQNISDSEYSLEQLAIDMNSSKSTLYRRIKEITGVSPVRFIRTVKLNYAKTLLRQQMGNIIDIAHACGFSDAKYFSRCFRDEYGISPNRLYSKI